MATNLDIAQELLEEAVKIGNHRSKESSSGSFPKGIHQSAETAGGYETLRED